MRDSGDTCVDSDIQMAADVTTRSDSDCLATKRREHIHVRMFKAYTRKQHIIVRSRAETELYAAELRTSESKGIVSMVCDLGYTMKLVLVIDAKAAEHIFHRKGMTRMGHNDVAHLWLHDEGRSTRLTVSKVEHNVSDLGSKALGRAVIGRHAETHRYVSMEHSQTDISGSGIKQQEGSGAVNQSSRNVDRQYHHPGHGGGRHHRQRRFQGQSCERHDDRKARSSSKK